ncbi:hypothetical protein NGF19_01490 [Streptomyces sp. RY43-2]|uniref:Uncharacterized protein n=1 Tax=Streptomyces macrolidinus TaxID=2952607 RepID=A0ABT0Z6S8_9ACTN|nr:hypothetical protein [Streptomyces macrolidinus]MCN9239468.1 hypothetical protein [Streptomyces macrolidinus]
MSEPLRRIADAVTDITEEEMAAVLTALGNLKGRERCVRETARTPLPSPRSASGIQSEVEWI